MEMYGYVRRHFSDPFVLFVTSTALLTCLIIAGSAGTNAESSPGEVAIEPSEATSVVAVLAPAADADDAPPTPAASNEPTYEFAWPGEGRINQGVTASHRGLDIAAGAGDAIQAVRERAGRRTASISTSSCSCPGRQLTRLAILSRGGTTCRPLNT